MHILLLKLFAKLQHCNINALAIFSSWAVKAFRYSHLHYMVWKVHANIISRRLKMWSLYYFQMCYCQLTDNIFC